MDNHLVFTCWAVSQGVELNGIAAHRIPGRGLGIIAKKRIEAGVVVLNVPSDALQNISTVPRRIIKAMNNGPVHGTLALSQYLDKSPELDPWRAVMPTMEDFQETMPLLWNKFLQDLLPHTANRLVRNQQRKYKDDLTAALEASPGLIESNYLYNWLIVNTRTFYWVASGIKKIPPRDDCLALVPFADYFNHADVGCPVSFSLTGITIISDRAYDKDEEVCISYGPHSNDFLLAEYGFILTENKWDEVGLDQVILPELSLGQQNQLKIERFYGGYVLDRDTVCHRTQVALRLLCIPHKRWLLFVSGEDDGEKDQKNVDTILLGLLKQYLKQANQAAVKVASSSIGLEAQRETLVRRWQQIIELLSSSITRLEAQ